MTFNLLLVLVSLAAGAGVGLFYFGGLWWTVRRLADSDHPALLTLGSFLIRVSLTLAALYLVSGRRWPCMLAALLGLLLARRFMVRRLGSSTPALMRKGVRS